MIRQAVGLVACVLAGCAGITGDSSSAGAGMGAYTYERYNAETGDWVKATATSGRDITGFSMSLDPVTGELKASVERLDGTAAQVKTLELGNTLIERMLPLLPPAPVALPPGWHGAGL